MIFAFMQIFNFVTIFGSRTAEQCGASKFLGILPTWYQYLDFDNACNISIDLTKNPGDLWLIGFAIIDILLRVAGLIAIGFVMYGGFRYVTSQGEPENLKAARNSIINALIGVAITVLATSVVGFIAGKF